MRTRVRCQCRAQSHLQCHWHRCVCGPAAAVLPTNYIRVVRQAASSGCSCLANSGAHIRRLSTGPCHFRYTMAPLIESLPRLPPGGLIHLLSRPPHPRLAEHVRSASHRVEDDNHEGGTHSSRCLGGRVLFIASLISTRVPHPATCFTGGGGDRDPPMHTRTCTKRIENTWATRREDRGKGENETEKLL